MANPAVANVIQGKPLTTGGVLRGAVGTALPTDASTAPASGFKALGYVGDAGLTEQIGRTTNKIRAWGGDVVKVTQSEFSVTYTFTLYEALNDEVQKAVYGDDNVTTTPATTTAGTLRSVKINDEVNAHAPWIFDMKDGKAKIRIVVPDGQITEVGDVTYDDGGVIGYAVTLEAFKDTSGNQAYHYLDDGVFSAV